MKKLLAVLTMLMLIVSVNVYAQEDSTPQETKDTKLSYMMLGLYAPFMYFPAPKDSSINYGLTLKAPVSNYIGVQLSLGSITVPITEFTINDSASTTGKLKLEGYGEEKYRNYQLAVLGFMPFHRYMQIKIGVDYYEYQRGFIARFDTQPATTNRDCGVVYTECTNCMSDLFGINAGINLDVPLYKQFFAMAYAGYRYIITKHPSGSSIIEFTLGVGYKL